MWMDFPSGPMVTDASCIAGVVSLILGAGTKIPPAPEQVNPCTSNNEPAHHKDKTLDLLLGKYK